jgi:SpoVK/Ycf46/Vps4 family AAA+-type ATPase
MSTFKRDQTHNKDGIYIVSQKASFLYNSKFDIHVNTVVTTETNRSEEKSDAKIDIITITLYSYLSNICAIQNYVDNLTNNYLENIEKSRQNQQFIYTLCKTRYENDACECWSEDLFDSTRTFENMFFERKDDSIKKIEFFLNNKAWYYKMGIPYSIGFGLHGPPGTGKTSFFKCLANMTKRHIVVIPLKLLKTKSDLDKFFYEDRYNYNNKDRSVGFDKKIIIFEDIDCLGDVVLKRDNQSLVKEKQFEENTSLSIEEIVQVALETKEDPKYCLKKTTTDEPITLDDILNLWDGLRETPGRIIGISSNRYELLDPALIRPGRIDVTLKVGNVSLGILREMYRKYYSEFDSTINSNDDIMESVKEHFYSPAEIVNCYLMYKNDPRGFMERLAKNEKF